MGDPGSRLALAVLRRLIRRRRYELGEPVRHIARREGPLSSWMLVDILMILRWTLEDLEEAERSHEWAELVGRAIMRIERLSALVDEELRGRDRDR